jgi:hypothetical protein
MLYTCSVSAAKKTTKQMKRYLLTPGHGNDAVTPDKRDLKLYKNGVITQKGFALNYEVKLRSQQAHEWMARVSEEATHEDILLISEEETPQNSCRTKLAEMMNSMFGGRMNLKYAGELE